ncbi:rhodanese-like domain-containing protein [Vampirovibrio chlorellavorus]|uniref:rhodanese-like domain-containing protein n=1 Tax=Vampirovibrio chlorellavorus TaxID=758823 RepID=UPI0026EB9539|nr:rhodanese-like domain-containing protein [Vampirovibrio chlorellavorus]
MNAMQRLKADQISAKENGFKNEFIIDVRSPDEFAQEHIPGSVNIPLPLLSASVDQLKSLPELILSCRSGNRANQAYQQLQAMGFHNVRLLEDGLQGWKAARRETVSFKKGYSIMQQVQIIVGIMVLTGTLYKPLWFLALMAGAGMLMAGLTNTCLMAVLLAKLPWNRIGRDSKSPTNCSLP